MAYTEYHRRQNADAGAKAFRLGKPDTANPKPRGTIMHDDWLTGGTMPETKARVFPMNNPPKNDTPDKALVERLRAMVSDDGRAIVCNGRTSRQMADDILSAADGLERLGAELSFACQPRFGEQGYQPPSQPTHQYAAHPEYPWFCEHCGYPAHEAMKHPQGIDAPKREASRER